MRRANKFRIQMLEILPQQITEVLDGSSRCVLYATSPNGAYNPAANKKTFLQWCHCCTCA